MAARRANQKQLYAEPDVTTRLAAGLAGGAPMGQKSTQPIAQPAPMNFTGAVDQPYAANPVVPPAAPMGQKTIQPVQGFGTMAPAPAPVAPPAPARAPAAFEYTGENGESFSSPAPAPVAPMPAAVNAAPRTPVTMPPPAPMAAAPVAPANETLRDADMRLRQQGMGWEDYTKNWDANLGGFGGGTLGGGFSSARADQMLGEIGKLAGFGGPATVAGQYTASGMNEGGETTYQADGSKINPELAAALAGYRVNKTGDYTSDLYDPTGKNLGAFSSGDRPSKFDSFMEKAVPVGLGLLTGGAASAAMGLGGVLGGAATGSIGGAVSTGIQGGSFQDILKAAAIGGLGGAAGGALFPGAGATGAGAGASGLGAAGDIGFLSANIPGISDAAIAAMNPALGAAGGLTGITGGAAAGAFSSPSAPPAPEPGNGAFLGENAASGVPSWDASAVNRGLPFDQTGMEALSTVGGADPSGMVPTSPADLQSFPAPDAPIPAPQAPAYTTAAADSQAANIAGNVAPGSVPTQIPNAVDLSNAGGLMSTGSAGSYPAIAEALAAVPQTPPPVEPAPPYTTAAADSQLAAEAASGIGGTPQIPNAVDLTNAGGIMSTGSAGTYPQIAEALAAAQQPPPETLPQAAPEYVNAAMDSQAANVPGVAGVEPPIATVPPAVDLGSLGGIMPTGAAVPSTFNPAMDSQAANVYNQTTPGSLPTTPPASVDLGSLGNYATGGGVADKIANALEAAKVNPAGTLQAAAGSVADFAKKNPGLAVMGANAIGTLAGGSPDLPALPGAGGAGGAGGTGTGAPGTLQAALEQHMNSMGATPDYGSIPTLKTSAGDLNTLNQQAIDAAYSQQTRMLDPQFQREMQTMEARLAEQGFVPGTPGYERAMSIFGEERTKAYGSARDSSILQGYNIGQGDARNKLADAELNNAASRETLAQILAKRNQPFNELASLKGNQQIDYNNQIDRYNAQTASSNSRNQALSQLALALGMYLG